MKKNWDIVIVTADEPYLGMTHTQILYANYLSKHFETLYIEPPNPWRIRSFLALFDKPRQQTATLSVHQYINILPSGFAFFSKINEWINQRFVSKQLKKKQVKTCLVWHFDSYRSVLSGKKFNLKFNATHLYHVIDPFYNNPADRLLCEISQLIVVTSPRNNIFYQAFEHKRINVAQCIDLTKELTFVQNVPRKTNDEKPYFVMLGTISDDIDFDLLNKVSQVAEVKLAGKINGLHKKKFQFDNLLSQKKLFYLGLLKPEQFYPLLKNARAGIVCYDLSIRSGNFSPLKVINYIVADIPVISNCNTEIKLLQDCGIYECGEANLFVQKCEESLLGLLKISQEEKSKFFEAISLQKAVESIIDKLF